MLEITEPNLAQCLLSITAPGESRTPDTRIDWVNSATTMVLKCMFKFSVKRKEEMSWKIYLTWVKFCFFNKQIK